MDKPLEETIKASRNTRRGNTRRGSGRAQILGTSPQAKAKAAAVKALTAAAPSPSTAEKIMVSNLPPDVNEQQIRDLFVQTVGAVREVTLHYDAHGRSKGVAAVHFKQKGDAAKAYEQYNNRLIDSKRPMRIEIVVDPSRVPLSARVAPAPAASTGATRGRGGGRGRGGRGGRPRKAERPPKSAADLDAEMEDYTASTGAPAAATAA